MRSMGEAMASGRTFQAASLRWHSSPKHATPHWQLPVRALTHASQGLGLGRSISRAAPAQVASLQPSCSL